MRCTIGNVDVSLVREGGAEGAAWTFGDALRPLREVGVVNLVETDHEVTPEVRPLPTPGHSPGQVSVLISSEGSARSARRRICRHRRADLRHTLPGRLVRPADPASGRVRFD